MLSLEGQQLGNYDVIRRIRAGGMGAVYEGLQRTAFGRRVAIKVILGDYASDREMRRRFAREARTIARLHHPHILQLIEFGDEKGILYLVMPFIDGGTLTSYLRRSLPGLDEVSAIYQQLLDAVEHAHEHGLIHRDIKSSNVLLEERRSGTPYVYLADFGLVRNARQADNSQTGKPIPLDQVPGTPHYMAPEQTRGIITPLTDIYALGVLLYQMLTGELPYNDSDDVRIIQMHLQAPVPAPSLHDASIPRELDEVVRKAMAKRPEDRYRTIAELRDAFLNALQGAPNTVGNSAGDDLLIEEVDDTFTPLLKHVPIPLELQDAPHTLDLAPSPPSSEREPLAPQREQQRPRSEAAPIALRGVRERQRTTEMVRPRQRVTEEPEPLPARLPHRLQHRKRTRAWMLAAIFVPLMLIVLLLMPRVLGFSFFPAGFPLFGTPPIATVYITPQSKMLQDIYVLTASPKVQQADPVTHTIPDRIVQSAASDSSTVTATGSKMVGGASAQGRVVFTNVGDTDVTLPDAFVLTAPSGVRFQVMGSVTVPAQQDGKNGKASVTVVAQQPGAAGNIAPHMLDGICCNDALAVKNNGSFAGGIDPQVQQVVAQSDIDAARNTLVTRLQASILQQLQQQLRADEVIAGTPSYQVNVSSNMPVGAQANQVQVSVSVTGNAIVYNRSLANQTAVQLLRASATQNLSSNYQAQGQPVVSATPSVQAGKDGSAFISISVHGQWSYVLTRQQFDLWRQSIRGATSAAARAYLIAQPGTASVQITLPFSADHLPDNTDNIKIVTVNQ